MSDNDLCYVILAEAGACAACVITGTSPKTVVKFLRSAKNDRVEIVTVARARELLKEYTDWKRCNPKIPDREPDGRFDCMATWVNKATSWIGGTNPLCVDAKGRRCTDGGHFQIAHDEGAFPVRFWYGAGGETKAQQRKSIASAKRAMKLQYPWRDKAIIDAHMRMKVRP